MNPWVQWEDPQKSKKSSKIGTSGGRNVIQPQITVPYPPPCGSLTMAPGRSDRARPSPKNGTGPDRAGPNNHHVFGGSIIFFYR